MRELSRFKVLSITLLVTMSSCVAGAIDLNAEMLRSCGLEFDISTSDKIQNVHRFKRVRTQTNSKFRLNRFVESGREQFAFRGLTLDYSPVTLQLNSLHLIIPQINDLVRIYHEINKLTYQGINYLNRAGPVSSCG